MERVHYQQEQMLDELKDLVDKGLFTEVRAGLFVPRADEGHVD